MYLREEKENMGIKENEKIKARFCTQCGSPLQPEDQFCSCCGQRIYTDEESGAVKGKTDQESVPQEKEDGESDKKAEQKSNENSMREKKSQGGEQEDTGLQQDYDAEEIKKIYGRIKNGQKMREPVFILNFWMVLLLSIVTGGIYLLYAEYRLNKDVDIICHNDGWENPSFLKVVILSFLTLGIYGAYWFYRQVQRVYEASDGYGVNPGLDGGLSIFLFIFGSFFLGIGPLVVCYLLIKNMERIADQYNKGVVNPNLNKVAPKKKKSVVKVRYVVIGILCVAFLGGIIEGFLSVYEHRLSDGPDEFTDEHSQTKMETDSKEQSITSKDKSSSAAFTDLPGLAGAYVDTDTGERLAVAEDGYLWAYTYYDKNGDVKCNEVECDWENALGGYIAGEQFNIMQDDAGILKLSLVDSSDGMYGNFRKVSGTTNTVRNVEGKYVNGTDYILVFNQMVDVDDEDVPTGADIADAVIYSSRTGKFTARLYTEQYGTLAIINSSNEVVKGIITFENGNAIVSGSAFDGTFELEKQ